MTRKRHTPVGRPKFRGGHEAARHRKTCSFCGKQGWETRREAKAMVKLMRLHKVTDESDDKIINVYECLRTPEGAVALFHIGHTRIEGDRKIDPRGKSWRAES